MLVRRCPGSCGVKPSVARTTVRARTTPRSVRTSRGAMDVTRVRSWIVTPRRSAARASPRTSRRRMDGRAVGGVRRARDAVGPHDPGRRRGVEERQVVLVTTPVPCLLDLCPGAGELGRAAGQPDRPALGDVGVDALRPGDPGDLVDGRPHRLVLGERSVPATAEGREGGQLRGEQCRAPAPVAPGGAEPGHLGLEHGHGQRRVRLGQVVGGPEPGVAGSDDGHVDVEVTREGRSRRPVVAGAVVPVREVGVRRLCAQRTPHEYVCLRSLR